MAERVDVAADGIARCDLVLAVLRRIAGTALDSASRPLANLTVSLADAAGRAVATATTDGGGRYAFDGVGPGEFVVTATRYVPVTATVPVGSNGAEQHLVLGATA